MLSYTSMIEEEIKKNLKTALREMDLREVEIDLERPANSDFGDFASSIPFKLSKELKKNPYDIALELVKKLPREEIIEKAEAVKPGFINFWISSDYLIKQVTSLAHNQFAIPHFSLGKLKKIMIEFAHPNTHKLFHIGHLRNISIGESLVRILESTGNNMIRSNYQGDIGLHIAKCIWYIRYRSSDDKLKDIRKKSLHERMTYLGKAYAGGQVAYDTDETAKKQIIDINGAIYKQEGDCIDLWKETRQWSYDYFEEIYQRVYTTFDRLYPESEFAKRGLELCTFAEKKGILKRSEGALVFEGKPYGLDTRVFINSHGYPTYEGKELALAETEFSEFGELDKCIHVVTPEQKSFFKVTFKVEELLDEQKYKNKQFHLAYEWVKLKEGKMSSRTGNVVEAEWLIDKAKKKILKNFKCDEDTAEAIAVGAVKYSFLKNNVFSQIAFDFDESITLEGNSGPYIQYTYVRCQSVLQKGGLIEKNEEEKKSVLLEPEEKILLRILIQFPDAVLHSAKELAPNEIANYLYSLAQSYSLFYQKHTIIKAPKDVKEFRLLLTMATANVIKKGLYLLGIKTVEKM